MENMPENNPGVSEDSWEELKEPDQGGESEEGGKEKKSEQLGQMQTKLYEVYEKLESLYGEEDSEAKDALKSAWTALSQMRYKEMSKEVEAALPEAEQYVPEENREAFRHSVTEGASSTYGDLVIEIIIRHGKGEDWDAIEADIKERERPNGDDEAEWALEDAKKFISVGE
jgi:hypothetical protein